MSASHAALRVGLIGGLVVGLAAVAQQMTDAPELKMLGLLLTFGGLSAVGWFAARDAAAYQRVLSVRAGAVSGLIAGLVSALAVAALLLVLSVNGEFAVRVEAALQQLYTPAQLQQIRDAGLTLEMLSQMTAFMQMMCCGAVMPVLGLVFGALGGSMASNMHGQRRSPP